MAFESPSECLLVNARVAHVAMVIDGVIDRERRRTGKALRNEVNGEWCSVRLRDDDAKALRLVFPSACVAVLRFAIEPIRIQMGSRKRAKKKSRCRSGKRD